MTDEQEANKAMVLIKSMMDFVNNKHPEWKNAEGSFKLNNQLYRWKIEKEA